MNICFYRPVIMAAHFTIPLIEETQQHVGSPKSESLFHLLIRDLLFLLSSSHDRHLVSYFLLLCLWGRSAGFWVAVLAKILDFPSREVHFGLNVMLFNWPVNFVLLIERTTTTVRWDWLWNFLLLSGRHLCCSWPKRCSVVQYTVTTILMTTRI